MDNKPITVTLKDKVLEVGDKCVVLIDGLPVSTKIVKKVTTAELSEGKVVETSILFIEHRGVSESYNGRIYAGKEEMLSELSSHLK